MRRTVEVTLFDLLSEWLADYPGSVRLVVYLHPQKEAKSVSTEALGSVRIIFSPPAVFHLFPIEKLLREPL
ncbi:hypothetical protein SD15574_1081 [Shigella dysenteriae 155-74]|nr:hypothetical protein SD15574_1978 [Shigella dysenteriae 155-74]EGJ01462.1 hypothetical protein SD15574_1081 [Shigella dysenteriae 155-74]